MTTARGLGPLPADADANANPFSIEVMQQIFTRIDVMERSITALQEAQTTVQQSMNLMQSAHNALHERMGSHGEFRGGFDSKPRHIMDNKSMVPPKFSGAGT